MKLCKGNVVKVKSGGHLMTVIGIVGQDLFCEPLRHAGFSDGDVLVEYFVNSKLEKASFRLTSLVKCELQD